MTVTDSTDGEKPDRNETMTLAKAVAQSNVPDFDFTPPRMKGGFHPANLSMPDQHAEELGKDIMAGFADLEAGRVRDFNIARVVEQGKKLLASD